MSKPENDCFRTFVHGTVESSEVIAGIPLLMLIAISILRRSCTCDQKLTAWSTARIEKAKKNNKRN